MHSAIAMLLAVVAAVDAAPSDRALRASEAFERNVLAELERIAPGAVPDARAAGEAYHAERWDEAIAGYERVLAAAPAFPHALRRICNAKLEQGDRAAALPRCREAVARGGTPVDEMALAHGLARSTPSSAATQADEAEAARRARAALARSTDDATQAALACDVAMMSDDAALLRSCADQLGRLAPGEAGTELFLAIAEGNDGRLRSARAHLARGAAAGLPPKLVAALGKSFDDAEPAYVRWGLPALWIGGAWVAGLVLLLGLGAILSAATLRAAGRLARAPHGTASTASRALRRVYGAVIWATCAFYYASLPLLLVAVLGAGAAVLYGFLAIGHIPVKLLLILGAVVVVTAWAVAKSLWVAVVRPRDGEDPGLRAGASAFPELAAFVGRVAARVGTRPVDAVFLTPGTDAAVYEKGGLARRLAGRGERCLVLGVGLLDGMTRGELASVLAHEYGHLVNRDTAGGGLALSVRRSVLTMARALAEGGAAGWYNPAWWFVRGFHRVFLRVSQGASRLQEVLADRWAALAYGGRTFARGLEHVIRRSVRFDAHAQRTLKEVIDGERALANLYAYAPAEAIDEVAVAKEAEEALAAEPSPYDSHPSPRDRIAWASPVEATASPDADADEPAWTLFGDRDALEREMTGRVRDSVAANHGVTIPAESSSAAA
jgi:Zn-dependent protease with chaperone function